ncbi:MAG: mevalonate kinase [Promethearchaeia archaeon]
MGTGSGKGKSILFGEHFVVYGLPALAAGIESETVAKVRKKDSPGWTLDDNRPAVPGYKAKKLDQQKDSIDNVIDFCGVDLSNEGIHIEFAGDLVCASGVGASAASCVSLARALNDEFGLDMTDEEINEAAYEGEKAYHGTPSGIDNTASTFGGLVWYERDLDGGSPTFEKIKLDKVMNLIIGSTGLTASTVEVVGDVRSKKEEDPSWFEKIAEEYEQLVYDAREALVNLETKKVGRLMNKNHDLLKDLTVSCEELDSLTALARESGALGAKLTGTGRGGNMIALAKDKEAAEKIAASLEEGGAAGVWTTAFGL